MTQFKGFQNGNPINCIFKAFQYISIAKRLVLTRYCDTLNALNILEAQLPEAKFNANENQHEIIKSWNLKPSWVYHHWMIKIEVLH